MGPAAHRSCELGGSHSHEAANRHWSWLAGSHSAPCRYSRSSPLVGPTLGCPHAPACLPPASLLQLPTSVITPRPYLPSFIMAVSRPFRTSSQSLEPCKYYCTSSLSFCTPFSCPRHGAVWSETARRLSTRAIYRESHNPIIVGHDCLGPLRLLLGSRTRGRSVSRIFPCSSLAPSTAVHPDSAF